MTDTDPDNANYLEAWREYRGMSRAQLASLVGTTQAMIWHWEKGERQLTSKILRRLAPALNCRPGDILDFHPHDVPADLRDALLRVTPEQRAQIAAVADTMASYQIAPSKK